MDSCKIGKDREIAPVHYLEEIGLNPADCIVAVIATHWHDDHINGISEIVALSDEIKFCASSAMTIKEFVANVIAYESRADIAGGSGAREIVATIDVLGCDRVMTRVQGVRPVVSIASDILAHGRDAVVTTLSPADATFDRFLTEVAKCTPIAGQTRTRLVPFGPNDLSVVTWIQVGEIGILLGGDLEETGEDDSGWSAILADTLRPAGRARIFKVPHHGADNAHHAGVWTEMIDRPNYATLTPYNRGKKKRPTPEDVKRICQCSDAAYITADPAPRRTRRRRAPAVEKEIRSTVMGRLQSRESREGCIRLRNRGTDGFDTWEVELFGGALPLERVST